MIWFSKQNVCDNMYPPLTGTAGVLAAWECYPYLSSKDMTLRTVRRQTLQPVKNFNRVKLMPAGIL